MTVTCTDSMLDNLLNLSNYGVRVKRVKTILDYTPQKGIDFGDIDNDIISMVWLNLKMYVLKLKIKKY